MGFLGDLRIMRRYWLGLYVSALLISISNQAGATTYFQNVFADGVPGTGGPISSNFCSATTCASGGLQTPFHAYSPGDIVDFGAVTLSTQIFCDGRGGGCEAFSPNLVVVYGNVPIVQPNNPFGLLIEAGACNEYSSPGCPNSLPRQTETYDLTFTIPDNATGIELGWSTPALYIPPVPEPSTWAMLLIGFAGIGFAGWHRTRLAHGLAGVGNLV
jgi:PEP-CTERM motif